MQKSPPHFLTHNNAIAGFTSQSLGLPAYVCKTGSSTAIKLAPKMHQNLPFWAQKSKTIWGGGIATSPDPLLVGRGTPAHTPPLGLRRLVPHTRHGSSPSLFKPWIRPWTERSLNHCHSEICNTVSKQINKIITILCKWWRWTLARTRPPKQLGLLDLEAIYQSCT